MATPTHTLFHVAQFFADMLRTGDFIPGTAHQVYCHLLYIANGLGWPKQLEINVSELSRSTRIHKQSYYKALEYLNTEDFIDWEKGNGYTRSTVTINPIYAKKYNTDVGTGKISGLIIIQDIATYRDLQRKKKIRSVQDEIFLALYDETLHNKDYRRELIKDNRGSEIMKNNYFEWLKDYSRTITEQSIDLNLIKDKWKFYLNQKVKSENNKIDKSGAKKWQDIIDYIVRQKPTWKQYSEYYNLKYAEITPAIQAKIANSPLDKPYKLWTIITQAHKPEDNKIVAQEKFGRVIYDLLIMNSEDHRQIKQIENVLKFAMNDVSDNENWKGWRSQIMSFRQLRKHYDTIKTKIK